MSAESRGSVAKTMAKTQTAPWTGRALGPEVPSVPGSRLPKTKVLRVEQSRAQAGQRRQVVGTARWAPVPAQLLQAG